MRKVDFLIIGAARSGTSSLHNVLSNHRSIYLPKQPPEPNFFFKDTEYKKGIKYYHQKYFNNTSTKKFMGEKSTSYFYSSSKVAKRIFNYNPNVKMV